MKPRKMVEPKITDGPPALCGRWDAELEGYCAAPRFLLVTKSPLSDVHWHELLVTRCRGGHILEVTGIEPDLNVFAEDDDTGAIGL